MKKQELTLPIAEAKESALTSWLKKINPKVCRLKKNVHLCIVKTHHSLSMPIEQRLMLNFSSGFFYALSLKYGRLPFLFTMCSSENYVMCFDELGKWQPLFLPKMSKHITL